MPQEDQKIANVLKHCVDRYMERERVKAAFEIVAKFDELNMIEVRTYIKEKIDKNLSDREFHKEIWEDQELHNVVKRILGMCEDVSLAIQFDYANEDILNRSIGHIVCWVYAQFEPYIAVEREDAKEPSLYFELETLNEKWKEGASLSAAAGATMGKMPYEPWGVESSSPSKVAHKKTR